MINLHPFFEILIIQIIFIVIYFLVFRKNGLHHRNRLLIWSMILLSLTIPYLSFKIFPIYITDVSNNMGQVLSTGKHADQHSENQILTLGYDLLSIIYSTGLFISASIFLYQIMQTILKIRKTPFQYDNGVFINLDTENQPSSFFKYVFLKDHNNAVWVHELSHVKNLHSLDRIALGVLICVFWPILTLRIFEKLLLENHEFTADEYAIKTLRISKSQYLETVLETVKKTYLRPKYQNLFSSYLKSRITMLSQNQLKNRWFYLIMLPVIFGLFSAFSFEPYYLQNNSEESSVDPRRNTHDTLVIFNPETLKETVYIINEKTLQVDDQDPIEVSGKIGTTVDTLIVFNPKTLQETYYIENNTRYLSVNFPPLEHPETIANYYFDKKIKSMTTFVKTTNENRTINLKFDTQLKKRHPKIIDLSGKEVFNFRIPVGVNNIEVTLPIMTPGRYLIFGLDDQNTIGLEIEE